METSGSGSGWPVDAYRGRAGGRVDAGDLRAHRGERARWNADAERGRRDCLTVVAGVTSRAAGGAIAAVLALVRAGGGHLGAMREEGVPDEVREPAELSEEAENGDVQDQPNESARELPAEKSRVGSAPHGLVRTTP